MLLTIVLIILTVFLATIVVGAVIWWVKFGRILFKMTKNMTQMNQNSLKTPDLTDFSKNFSDQMKMINEFMKKRK